MYININLTLFVRIGDKMKNKPYHTAGTVPNSKRKKVERGKIDTPTINSWINNLILKKMHCYGNGSKHRTMHTI
jgi:hypothetical protein